MIHYKELSDKIIGIAIDVHKTLGNGYLEKIYENAMMLDFYKSRIRADQQVPLPVHYKNKNIGDYFADIVVDKKIILELKTVSKILPIHEAQLLHYLKSSRIKVGYLLNFDAKSKLEFKRMVY
ncbi:MAG: GxxExxY protein [Candidatus Marinimicrobia bacterium]|mgnify:FL=1|jgi:GxxExxY protein|nr:GxxExxY protein [Candidatus Neomarinimicrobiota bacterium]MBT5068471.1 GxxExxY protein [Candidatus Neomarinimicrobiota bacterium]MBT5996761.1 GxxExxY protein [Candidatus Neomarinimicrobiota bacterium]MBT7271050.1 GxxExxY protein [Candidatus Neomarinimicrobiota bacterium]